MNEEQLLLARLNARIAGAAAIRCKIVSAMWIIEIVHGGIAPATKQNYIDEANQALADINTQYAAWKLFLYGDLSERFVENGTLHTIDQDYSSDGTSITTLSAADCYLDITAFDAESMHLDLEGDLVVLGRESKNDKGRPVLPYQPNSAYLWLEALGGYFEVASNGTRRLPDGNIEIKLKQK